jgi:hypothetical protein
MLAMLFLRRNALSSLLSVLLTMPTRHWPLSGLSIISGASRAAFPLERRGHLPVRQEVRRPGPPADQIPRVLPHRSGLRRLLRKPPARPRHSHEQRRGLPMQRQMLLQRCGQSGHHQPRPLRDPFPLRLLFRPRRSHRRLVVRLLLPLFKRLPSTSARFSAVYLRSRKRCWQRHARLLITRGRLPVPPMPLPELLLYSTQFVRQDRLRQQRPRRQSVHRRPVVLLLPQRPPRPHLRPLPLLLPLPLRAYRLLIRGQFKVLFRRSRPRF